MEKRSNVFAAGSGFDTIETYLERLRGLGRDFCCLTGALRIPDTAASSFYLTYLSKHTAT